MSCRSWVVAAVCTILAVTLVGCGSDDDEPTGVRSYIASNYTRATSLDEENDGIAYTAGAKPVAVADEITGAERPLDRRSAGTVTFLQYRHDIIAISENGSGSKILVDHYANGHRRHHSSIAGFGWPANNTGFRGGGPGEGK